MSTLKRKALGSTLQRRVRARRDPSEELVAIEDDAPSEEDVADSDKESGSENESQSGEEEDESASEDEETSQPDSEPEAAESISFGALVKAQASLQKTKKLKDPKKKSDDPWMDNEAAERKAGHKDHRDFSRSNKHAPTEMSSKKAVSRKRDVVTVHKREFRDPRFDPLSGFAKVDETKVKKAYGFLDSYRDDEMKELKERIRKEKDENTKERLKRQLLSMESKKKTEVRKAKEMEILDKHRKEEKELVKQGKQPFYLKKAEQKKQLLLDQFQGLKGKQLDRVIERKRKKVEGKEKKLLPYGRRDFDGEK